MVTSFSNNNFGRQNDRFVTPCLTKMHKQSGKTVLRMPALHLLPNTQVVASVNGNFATTCNDGVARGIQANTGYASFDRDDLAEAIGRAESIHTCVGDFGSTFKSQSAVLVELAPADAQAYGVDLCKVKAGETVLSGVILVSVDALQFIQSGETYPSLAGSEPKTYDLMDVTAGLAMAKSVTNADLASGQHPCITQEFTGPAEEDGKRPAVAVVCMPRGGQRQERIAQRYSVEGDDDLDSEPVVQTKVAARSGSRNYR